MGTRFSFHGAAESYYAGEIDLNEFFRLSKPDLTRVAGRLIHRWKMPATVGVEDVVQELMIGCPRYFKKYDRTRANATSVGQYVLYNACCVAKRWMHHQRGASLSGNYDKNPSHMPLYLEDMKLRGSVANRFATEASEIIIDSLIVSPNQDEVVEVHEKWKAVILKAPTMKLRWGLLALVTTHGEPEKAADVLYANTDVRLRLRMVSHKSAEKIVQAAWKWLQAA